MILELVILMNVKTYASRALFDSGRNDIVYIVVNLFNMAVGKSFGFTLSAINLIYAGRHGLQYCN